MTRFSLSKFCSPIQLAGAVALAATLGFASVAGSAPAAPSAGSASGSPLYGRWQVDDAEAHFSNRGRAYKVIDIAPCGRDFCGVSVGGNGRCGATLFRFLGRHADGHSRLMGRGVWGTGKRDVTIDAYAGETPEAAKLDLYIGNGHDFGERGGSMPMFNASYERNGQAQCRAR
ncbi:MAG: hypothetical protein AB7F98_04120 [Novosphingobium sp.]